MTEAVLLWSLAIVLLTVGTAGLMLPALPGAPLMFLGFVVAGWADDFTYLGPVTLGLFAILSLLTYLIDIVAGLAGAKRFNASRLAMFGATVGVLIGLFFGLPGILLGPFVGAVAGELYNRRHWREAGWSGLGTVLGMLLGAVLKLTLAFSMLGWFLFVRFA